MVLLFSTTLAVSVVCMLLLLGLKRYELSSGSVFFAGARPALSTFFHNALFWVERVLPALLKSYTLRALRALRSLFWKAIALGVIVFERTLERVLHTVREKTAPSRAPGEASAFLREVADHKKNLLYKKSLLKKPRPRDSVQE